MTNSEVCLIIGASHSGVNCAFALRKESWKGKIILLDSDPHLPYHRPPLSKAYLSTEEDLELNLLKSEESYLDARIDLRLGVTVINLDAFKKIVTLDNGSIIQYDKLVLAVGAKAFLPHFEGLSEAKNLFTLRKAADAYKIRSAFKLLDQKRIVIIGGGYIGLETAASLNKLGANVTILERESRVLARVTAPEISAFFTDLHTQNGTKIYCGKTVQTLHFNGNNNQISCEDGSVFDADMIIVGVGIKVNIELAIQAGLNIEAGISVDQSGMTSDENIYAIGDCAFQFNNYYGRNLRLESVQNAVDQAKVVAATLCGIDIKNDATPWFWSDQYDVKLQIVGLSAGYDNLILRIEKERVNCLSAWYFKGDQLLSVDAVNNAKAYVLGGKFIRGGNKIDKIKLADENIELKPANLLLN